VRRPGYSSTDLAISGFRSGKVTRRPKHSALRLPTTACDPPVPLHNT